MKIREILNESLNNDDIISIKNDLKVLRNKLKKFIREFKLDEDVEIFLGFNISNRYNNTDELSTRKMVSKSLYGINKHVKQFDRDDYDNIFIIRKNDVDKLFTKLLSNVTKLKYD